MQHITIGKTIIGEGLPPYVIAEIGVNHNGNLDTALTLIRRAAESGVNAVKFQTFSTDRIVTQTAPKAIYQQKNTKNTDPQYAMLKALEVPEYWYSQLIDLCTELHIGFISTPYDVADVEFLRNLNIDAFKVPSAWAVEPEYLISLASCDAPILLSTGMCTINEVVDAINIITKNNDRLVVMHCTTDYPTKLEDCNVRVIQTYSRIFPYLVGFSDHSQSHIPAILATALGACVIERHFTLDTSMPGPDHSSSDTPEQLSTLVQELRYTYGCLGRPEKRPVGSEFPNIFAMRRSLVAAQAIHAGEIIKREHLALKRPATGIAPRLMESVINSKALCSIQPDQHITIGMVDIDENTDLYLKELTPEELPNLKTLFTLLKDSSDKELFHPHPFTTDYAEWLCKYTGSDYYSFVICNNTIVGYVMLRGWDEGYDIPTIGIYIIPEQRGKKLAIRILKLLEAEAKQRGANRIMAKVNENNTASLRAFTASGYIRDHHEDGVIYLYVELC